MDARTTVVIATRDRRDQLLASLERLAALPERPPIVVVDNGSTDETPAAVRARYDRVTVVELDGNAGASARNVGVGLAQTPYVAFSDDDSWWAPGALRRAAEYLDAHPRLAVLQARILVGRDERLDPTCAAMATGSLGSTGLPGPTVLGFVACGAVVRREAFLSAGGFDDLLFFFGEETLLAQDLATRGWALAYVEDVVAHHVPCADAPNRDGRRRRAMRNELLAVWMRRPLSLCVGRTWRVVRAARSDRAARGALLEAIVRSREAWRRRRRLPAWVEAQVRHVEAAR